MSFQFEFNGGSHRESGDKFLLFLVVNGQEEILYQAKSLGLIRPSLTVNDPRFMETSHQIIKIFALANVHDSKIIQSFYFEMSEDVGANRVEIRPLNGADRGHYFRSHGRFLKKKEILSILGGDNPSRPFVERQRTLPRETLRRMITIERPVLAFEGRRVGRKVKKKKEA